MFLHSHPYEPFLFRETTKLIVGTLPPPRFSTRNLKPGDVDFCYGSADGQLWRILERIFDLQLSWETTTSAVEQRKNFLRRRRIGICDIVKSARRLRMDASDLGMQDIQLRDLLGYLHAYPKVHTLLFTGGNSKNGPEFLFRKLLKREGLTMRPVSLEVPRIHEFFLAEGRNIRTISLTAPSGAANRAVGSMKAYQRLKEKNPEFNTVDFRVMQYKAYF